MFERATMLLLLTTALVMAGCSKDEPAVKARASPIRVGGVYATPDKDGSWTIVRVLALDEHTVHLRSYTDRFAEQPKDVDLAKLKWFIGHMPLAREGFEKERTLLIKVVPVADEELEGYKLYLQAMNPGPPAR
jgi:hypothetical protein